MVTEQLHNLQQRVNKMFLLRNRPGKRASTPLRGVHILSQVGNENNWTFSLTHRHTHMWTVNTNDPFSGTEKLWNLWEIMEFREIMVKLWTPFLYLFSAHLRKVCKPVAWVGGSGSSWRAWPLVEGTWATSALPGSPLTSLSRRLFSYWILPRRGREIKWRVTKPGPQRASGRPHSPAGRLHGMI